MCTIEEHQEMQASDDGMPVYDYDEHDPGKAEFWLRAKDECIEEATPAFWLRSGTIVRTTTRRTGAQKGQVIGFDPDLRLPLVRWFDEHVEAVTVDEVEVVR